VLNGVSSTNWHEWEIMQKSGMVVGHHQGASPNGHVAYGDVVSDLKRVGYFRFSDPHKDHWGGINFMTTGSPTLNITVSAGPCGTPLCAWSEPVDPSHAAHIEAHGEKYNPYEQFLDHQLKEVIPNIWNRIKPW